MVGTKGGAGDRRVRFLDGYLYLDMGEVGPDLRVSLRIAEDSLTLTTADQTLGAWTRIGWDAEQVSADRFRVWLDGESFIFAPDNLLEFKYEVIPEFASYDSAISSRTRLARRWRMVAAALAIALVVLAVVARGQLAVVASVLGAFLLFAALVAQLEAPVAARFTEKWTPNRVLLIGLGMLIGGGMLSWLG
ncbi:MAG: hypothetical protein ACE5MI_02670 [Acidimicrobiia bacterium]